MHIYIYIFFNNEIYVYITITEHSIFNPYVSLKRNMRTQKSPIDLQGDMAPITWPGKIIAPRSKRKALRVTRAVMKFIWANYNDLFPPSSHLKLWFSKGIPLKSPKHSGLGIILICPDLCLVVLYQGIRDYTQFFGGNWMFR